MRFHSGSRDVRVLLGRKIREALSVDPDGFSIEYVRSAIANVIKEAETKGLV